MSKPQTDNSARHGQGIDWPRLHQQMDDIIAGLSAAQAPSADDRRRLLDERARKLAR
jgi:hypothetical protein